MFTHTVSSPLNFFAHSEFSEWVQSLLRDLMKHCLEADSPVSASLLSLYNDVCWYNYLNALLHFSLFFFLLMNGKQKMKRKLRYTFMYSWAHSTAERMGEMGRFFRFQSQDFSDLQDQSQHWSYRCVCWKQQALQNWGHMQCWKYTAENCLWNVKAN